MIRFTKINFFLVEITKNRNAYFVNRLKNAMKGLGADDKTLIRVIVSRSERDLLPIKQEWERQFAAHLANTISVSLLLAYSISYFIFQAKSNFFSKG